MKLPKLPNAVVDIILDYKYQLEHAEMYAGVLRQLRTKMLFKRVVSLYKLLRSSWVEQQSILDWGWW